MATPNPLSRLVLVAPLLGLTLGGFALSGCSSCGSSSSTTTTKTVEPPKPAANPCTSGGAVALELHAKDGAVELTLRAGGPGESLILCDGESKLLGTVANSPEAFTFKDAAGAVGVTLAFKTVEDATLTIGAVTWKISDVSDLLRILDDANAPIGQLGRQGERAIAFGSTGAPLATAQKGTGADEDKKVVRAPDGDVMKTLVGMKDERAAAAFGLDKLSPPAMVVLARWMESKPRVAPPVMEPPKDPKKGKGKAKPAAKPAENKPAAKPAAQ